MCGHHEGGHIGPPLQKQNYLYERNLVLIIFFTAEAQRTHMFDQLSNQT